MQLTVGVNPPKVEEGREGGIFLSRHIHLYGMLLAR